MARRQQDAVRGTAVRQQATYTIQPHHRHWEVRDSAGELVCLTVYKRGAQEVIRRMSLVGATGPGSTTARE